MSTSISSLTVQDLLSNAAWTRRLAVRLLGDRDSAEDVVQETWIAALRARPDTGESVRPWLARVLRNRAASHHRDHGRRVARQDRSVDLAEAASEADPEALLSRVQVQRVLAELITALAEPARQTVLLRYYEGLTSEQIGAVMGVPAGTVRRRLKEAIDELRDQLDRRHQGNRDTWRLALLPLGAPSPPTAPARPVWLLRIAMGASILGLAAGGVLLTSRVREVRHPPGRGVAAADVPGGSGRGGGAWLAAALPATFDSCRPALATRRKELAAAEIAYRKRAPRDVLFEQGAPNPTARAVLLPEIERILRDDEGVSFSLECRTWACRVLLAVQGAEPGTRMPPSVSSVAWDEFVKQRTRDWWYLPGTSTRDPISGTTYLQAPVYLVLKSPSGAPVVGPPPALDDATGPRLEPRTLQACQSELQAAEERLAYVRRVIDGRMSLSERFRESEFDPVLTLDTMNVVARALHGAASPTPDIVCRGHACRLSVPGKTTSDSWRQLLERDPGFSSRISESVVTPEALVVGLRETGPVRQNPATMSLKIGREILAAVDLHACAARDPATTGDLLIGLQFPNTRQAPPPGAQPPAITVNLRGAVARTPVGACVEEALNRAARSTPVPDSSAGSVTFYRSFPLEPDAGT